MIGARSLCACLQAVYILSNMLGDHAGDPAILVTCARCPYPLFPSNGVAAELYLIQVRLMSWYVVHHVCV